MSLRAFIAVLRSPQGQSGAGRKPGHRPGRGPTRVGGGVGGHEETGPLRGPEEAPVSPPLSTAGPVSAAAEATKRGCCLQKAGSREDLGLRVTPAWQDSTASPSLWRERVGLQLALSASTCYTNQPHTGPDASSCGPGQGLVPSRLQVTIRSLLFRRLGWGGLGVASTPAPVTDCPLPGCHVPGRGCPHHLLSDVPMNP